MKRSELRSQRLIEGAELPAGTLASATACPKSTSHSESRSRIARSAGSSSGSTGSFSMPSIAPVSASMSIPNSTVSCWFTQVAW